MAIQRDDMSNSIRRHGRDGVEHATHARLRLREHVWMVHRDVGHDVWMPNASGGPDIAVLPACPARRGDRDRDYSTTRMPIAPFCPCPKPWFTNGNSPAMSQTSSNTIPPPGGTANVCTPRMLELGGAPR